MRKDEGFLVYLAGPIDAITEGQANGWRRNLSEELLAAGITCYNPASFTFGGGSRAARFVLEVNESALEKCDLLVAFIPPDVATVGTVMELCTAMRKNKPVLVASPVNFVALHEVSRVDALADVPDWVVAFRDRWARSTLP